MSRQKWGWGTVQGRMEGCKGICGHCERTERLVGQRLGTVGWGEMYPFQFLKSSKNALYF